MQSKEIAARLGRSKPTVESYIRTLFIKLDARSRAQLVAVAIRTGVIDVTAA
jgi:DNA-binding CsgD family transcriptional regulator